MTDATRRRAPDAGSTAHDASGGFLRRLLRDEGGQDVIEYALLGALIGIAAILTWRQIATTTGVVYGNADAAVQGVSGCTPDPGGGGCP